MKKRTLAIVAVIVAALGGGLIALGEAALAPPSGIPAGGSLFEVKKGESTSALAARLEREGVIRSGLAFAWVARVRGETASLRSGTYRLDPGMGTMAVLRRIVEGRESLQKITIPEGLSLKETAELLEKEGIAPADEFEKDAKDPALLATIGIPGDSAEGYLFPDTYFMPRNYGALSALKELVTTFKSKLASIPETVGLDAKAIREKVILASIIEKEYRIPEEAPVIASVFDNRLRIGMGLQSCATVVYVITERLGKPHPDIVYDKDLRLQDPFNTYIHRGLPPAPISSPGLVALRAAFEPATTKYLYFRLVDPVVGTHHFSITFDEHLRAGQLVLKRTSSS